MTLPKQKPSVTTSPGLYKTRELVFAYSYGDWLEPKKKFSPGTILLVRAVWVIGTNLGTNEPINVLEVIWDERVWELLMHESEIATRLVKISP